jgi:hypothetical protein
MASRQANATLGVRTTIFTDREIRQSAAMNKTLERAVAAAAALSDDAQETIANLILAEMEAERGWEQRFANSETRLAELARRARAEHARGETNDLAFPPDR